VLGVTVVCCMCVLHVYVAVCCMCVACVCFSVLHVCCMCMLQCVAWGNVVIFVANLFALVLIACVGCCSSLHVCVACVCCSVLHGAMR